MIYKNILTMTKKAQSAAYLWVFGLFTLFGLGVLYIVFSNVFTANLVPVIKNLTNQSTLISSADKLVVYAGIDRYMAVFHVLPFVLAGVVILYMFVKAFQKEGDSSF